jgi:flagellar hook-length control protein FliK
LADPTAPAVHDSPTADAGAARSLNQPVGQGAWREELGAQIVWLADRGGEGVRLKLNPAHLGPMDVSIKLDGDGVSIQFTAHHPEVRDALEAAVPRLREMLGAQHLALNEVAIAAPPSSAPSSGSDPSFDFHRQPGFGQGASHAGSALATEPDSAEAADPGADAGRSAPAPGLVNLFA